MAMLMMPETGWREPGTIRGRKRLISIMGWGRE